MNKQEAANVLAKEFGCSESKGLKGLNVLLDAIVKDMEAGNKVVLTGFGAFSLTTVPAHRARNPLTNQMIDVPEKKAVRFHQGSTLKQRINGK